MTPADVLAACETAGLRLYLKGGGQLTLWCPTGVRPNAALEAAIREHKPGIVELLGGTPEPEVCPGGWHKDRAVPCGAIVFRAVDSEALCDRIGCPMRRRARG